MIMSVPTQWLSSPHLNVEKVTQTHYLPPFQAWNWLLKQLVCSYMRIISHFQVLSVTRGISHLMYNILQLFLVVTIHIKPFLPLPFITNKVASKLAIKFTFNKSADIFRLMHNTYSVIISKAKKHVLPAYKSFQDCDSWNFRSNNSLIYNTLSKFFTHHIHTFHSNNSYIHNYGSLSHLWKLATFINFPLRFLLYLLPT